MTRARTKRIMVRVSPPEVDAIKANARAQGKPYATLMRELGTTGRSVRASEIAQDQWNRLAELVALLKAEWRHLVKANDRDGYVWSMRIIIPHQCGLFLPMS